MAALLVADPNAFALLLAARPVAFNPCLAVLAAFTLTFPILFAPLAVLLAAPLPILPTLLGFLGFVNFFGVGMALDLLNRFLLGLGGNGGFFNTGFGLGCGISTVFCNLFRFEIRFFLISAANAALSRDAVLSLAAAAASLAALAFAAFAAFLCFIARAASAA